MQPLLMVVNSVHVLAGAFWAGSTFALARALTVIAMAAARFAERFIPGDRQMPMACFRGIDVSSLSINETRRALMDAAAKSLVAYGTYLLLNAVALVLVPNTVLTLLGVSGTSEPWIRVLGLVAGEIGFYFIFAARRGLSALYPATVRARGVASLVFLVLVITHLGPWQLLIFGAVDLISAVWTKCLIRGNSEAPSRAML